MAAKQLRAVGPDEQAPAPEPPKVLSIEEAAEKGDRLAELKAMRLIIARALPGAPPRDMAALSRRQIEIGREIEALQIAEGEESVIAGTADEAWDASAI